MASAGELGRMGLLAAMLTYLVSAALLASGMIAAGALLFAKSPDDGVVAQKPRPPLVRAAERQAAEALKTAPPSKAAPAPQSTDGSAANRLPGDAPPLKAAEPARRLAGETARKKKVAKTATPAPARAEDLATLGYSPWPPRKFVFPLDPDW